jgi:alpha-L-fucosidase 2
LPALPKAWPGGSVTGLKARGGYTVSLDWKSGTLARISLLSALGGPCRLRLGDRTALFEMRPRDRLVLGPGLEQLSETAGEPIGTSTR